MQTFFGQTTGRTDRDSGWASRIKGFTGVLGGILFLAQLHTPMQALSQNLLSSYMVNLEWGASSSSGVTGYRVYYGGASGNYTNSVVAGTVTANTVPGLASGVPYFFAVTAFNASGQESPFSNEISFVPGPRVEIRAVVGGQARLTVSGLAGHAYEIQATPDLTTWSVIGTATVGVNGSVNFTNSNIGGLAKRFYRTRDMQP